MCVNGSRGSATSSALSTITPEYLLFSVNIFLTVVLLELTNQNNGPRTQGGVIKALFVIRHLDDSTSVYTNKVCHVNKIGKYFMCFVSKKGSVYHDHRRL